MGEPPSDPTEQEKRDTGFTVAFTADRRGAPEFPSYTDGDGVASYGLQAYVKASSAGFSLQVRSACAPATAETFEKACGESDRRLKELGLEPIPVRGDAKSG